ncbi:MAG: sigma-70 family RNA polymerase sigma factor [Hormoscilla sp. GM7CHS1pb]|nr:sigma-70 family RNA polymerase sigma factor [Hormoscilla sp. GM7CHS1pb]
MVVACEGGLAQGGQEDIISQFWSVWLELEKKLYRRCLALMNGNVTEAEDALSSARLKAWEKVQKFAGQIENLSAWLMQLTSNLCKDLIEKNSRGPAAVEDIEWVGDNGVLCTASGVATPMMVLEREEQYVVIRQAVESLPQGQRDTFVLHYYEGLKHKEIVEELGISYDSVCQQISKARKQLKTSLRGYFCDEEELERALEPKVPNSPAPRGRAKKRKIGSCGSKEKVLATVSTAPDCVVGSGLADCKDGAVNVEQESTQVCTQWDASSPVRAPVASGEQLLCSPLGGETVLTAPECVPVGIANFLVPKAPVKNTAVKGIAAGTTGIRILSKVIFCGPLQKKFGASEGIMSKLATEKYWVRPITRAKGYSRKADEPVFNLQRVQGGWQFDFAHC